MSFSSEISSAIEATDEAHGSLKKTNHMPLDADDQTSSLLRILRTPSAQLPNYVDEKFLERCIYVVNSDIRRMHQDRAWIRAVTGFPWPETKPNLGDIPRLYTEALEYPAFAIVIQHQFFPYDVLRGLPNRHLRRQYRDLSRRVRNEKPLPLHEKHLLVLEVLRARELGGDLSLLRSELLGTPGQLAWDSLCNQVCDGLDQLETHEEFQQMARYLRQVVGHFSRFDSDQTIGKVFETVLIPEALKRQTVVATPPISNVAALEPQNPVEAEAENLTFEIHSNPEPASAQAIEYQWRNTCDELSQFATEAKAIGPSNVDLKRLKSLVLRIEQLDDTFAKLTPQTAPTESVREALRKNIADASTGLEQLIGDTLGAPLLLSRLFELPKEAAVATVEKASYHQRQGQAFVEQSNTIAQEVTRLENTLPVRQAREKTSALLDEREKLLRNALAASEETLNALTPAEQPVSLPIATAVIDKQPATAQLLQRGPIDVDAPADASIEVVDTPMVDPSEPFDREMVFAPAIPPVQATEEVTYDPLHEEIIRKLDELFASGEHGLAFHLHAAASTAMSTTSLPYTAAEFRLAAAAGRTTGLTGPEHFALAEQRGEALSIAQSLAEMEDDRSLARRNLLLAAAIPVALFRAEDTAAVSLVESLGSKGPFSHYFKLINAVEENRKRGFPLTPANVLAVEAHNRDDTFVKDAIASIKETVEGFKSSRFRFQLGEKVKHALTHPQGLLGRLSTELTESDTISARSVAEELNGRDNVLKYLNRIATDIGTGQDVDGAARERILSLLTDIGHQCSDLIQTIDGFDALRRSGGRLETIRRIRDLALAGLDDVFIEAEVSGSLEGASKVQGSKILTSLRNLLRGGLVERESAPLAVNLHGPLLWLPGLTWTGGWTPSPYDADKILQEILAAPIPLLRENPSESLKTAFEARRAESAFVPAYMLLNISRWFGLPADEADALRNRLDADTVAKKSQVAERLRSAERLIEKMRRMAVGSLDQSARLKETLSAINPNNLPVELPPTFLPETLSGDRIEDFNSALNRIRDVESEAQREFDKATLDYRTQIAELKNLGTLDAQTAGELKNLLDRREFTTLADWLNMLRTGGIRGPALPSGAINKRLAWFRSVLPNLGTVEPLQAARAVESGLQMRALDYSVLGEDRREEGARILRGFPELKRLVKAQKAANGAQIGTKVDDLISQLLYDVTHCQEDPVMTRVRQEVYVFDVRVALPPSDPRSLVLPEFGSLTQGSWRVCVVTPTISPQALVELANGAGLRGVVVLYLGVLNSDRREQLRLDLSRRKQAMLVIDEALVAATIADSEDRRRAIIEIAQGYSSADPYKDHGKSAVPPEMFKGRSLERSEIIDPAGSYVVFGGRRLGKTALLRQIHASPPPNAIFAYVDLDMVNDASDALEQMSRKIGDSVFLMPTHLADVFASSITVWLDADERRRILLLIDEADKFIRNEADTGFKCVQTMLKLMAETKHRFKFVLAGLHNVSRIVRTENSPLVQISNNPLKIGPLLNRDVDDAEFLVRGPLAAMGFEFDSREDVWRILSFTNYYPVLIQVFCKELLRLLQEQAQHTGRTPESISTVMVERALSSSDVRSKLFASFEKTITSIENRYELITYILAARELVERDSGMDAEGMSAAEVADRAMEYWPSAFQRGSDSIELEYLLEEMEGFGIARRTVSGGFALRSRSLLELMVTSEAELTRKLSGFKNLPTPPKPFDPKNFRRALGKSSGKINPEGRISPLTDGQEADLLTPPVTSPLSDTLPNSPSIGVVFGTKFAGVQYVEAALLDARRVKDRLVEIDIKTFATKKEMLDEAKRPVKNEKMRVIVVSSSSPWRPDWVVDAERIGRVRKGDVRLVFVGEPTHARIWAADSTVLKRVLPHIKIVKLRPWTRSYLGSRIESLQLPLELVDSIREATGGWSELVGPLLDRIAEKPSEASAFVAEESKRLINAPDVLNSLGIPPDLSPFFRELAAYADGSTITQSDLHFLCTDDGRNIPPRTLQMYSDAMGIMSFPYERTDEQGGRRVHLNPLAHATLLRPE